MTPDEAIQILDNIAAQVALPRRQHEIAMEAIVLLKQIVAEQAALADTRKEPGKGAELAAVKEG